VLRWREQSPAHWSGVLADQVWTLTQTEEQLYCTVYRGDKGCVGRPTPEELETVHKYFRLDVSLAQLYSHWGSVDSHFQEVAQKFQGEYKAWGRGWDSVCDLVLPSVKWRLCLLHRILMRIKGANVKCAVKCLTHCD
jgi:hypothetical protein